MSDAIIPEPPIGNELLVRAAESGELTTQLDLEQLGIVEAQIDAALKSEEAAIETIRQVCGPAPGFVASRLVTILQMGSGHTRLARDLIRALWRTRNAAIRRAESC